MNTMPARVAMMVRMVRTFGFIRLMRMSICRWLLRRMAMAAPIITS
ncbi:Uncharacterised protein [uncultured Blautia sp.]|nr:Uncharacterised protein [uncultured Blautia sp.]